MQPCLQEEAKACEEKMLQLLVRSLRIDTKPGASGVSGVSGVSWT